MMRLRHLLADDFLRHNAIYFSGSLAVAVLNYLYHPIVGRLLPIDSFGEVQAAFAFASQLGMVFVPVGYLMVNIVASYPDHERSLVLHTLDRLAIYGCIAISAVLAFFAEQISATLKFDSPLIMYLVIGILLANVFYTVSRSRIQGRRDFRTLSVAGIVVAAGRLALAVGFIGLGYGVFGAIGALLIAQVVAALFAYYMIRDKSERPTIYQLRRLDVLRIIPELSYGVLVLAAVGFVLLITNADVILVNALFPPDVAGLYSGISIVARTIFFLTGSIAGVVLPSVSHRFASDANIRVLHRAITLVVLIGGITAVIFAVFPGLVIRIFLGPKFVTLAGYLPTLALLSFVASVVNVLIAYFLALRDKRLWASLAAGLVTGIVSLFIAHSQPLHIAYGFLWGTFAAASVLVLMYARDLHGVLYAKAHDSSSTD